jgi:hypothetical protein
MPVVRQHGAIQLGLGRLLLLLWVFKDSMVPMVVIMTVTIAALIFLSIGKRNIIVKH